MLGESGTEQFTVTTYRDGEKVQRTKIHDPFIRCTVTIGISRWDLFKAIFRKQFETKINVCVDGTEGMSRTIMMLDTKEIERETASMLEARRRSRENSVGSINHCYVQNDVG